MSINKYDLYAVMLAILLASISFCAKAGAFVNVGHAKWERPTNGIWWQDQYPHSFDLNANYFRFGGEYKSMRLSYFQLGSYQTEALATPEESKYFSGECNASTCQAPDLYKTSGNVRS